MVNKDGVHVGVYSFEEFKPFLKAPNDSIYVLNFWATWCGPCVKELPYFEKLQANYKDKGVRVILVSLDFLKQLEDKLVPFMQKKQLKSEVIVLDQKGGTDWMSEIEESWEGALPATIIYKGNKRVFNAKSYDYEELEAELKPFL
ncbi:MAG: TlpA family protein disulfide reductase [Aureispira sp.]|nr:TlpA family protein disulfide reductase [Aureispira sp.]